MGWLFGKTVHCQYHGHMTIQPLNQDPSMVSLKNHNEHTCHLHGDLEYIQILLPKLLPQELLIVRDAMSLRNVIER